MNSMTKHETLVNLGYTKDPFKAARFETGDMVRCRRILTMAVESRAMMSIVGERGIGKTEAILTVLRKMPVRIVTAQRDAQEKLTIDHVKNAIIQQLSDESVKRCPIASHAQLRRVLGENSRKQQVVVVIEEAQRLHASTLRSLKTLREIEFAGEKELCTIILVAQSDPMNRAGVSEVRLRSDLVRMQGLSATEAAHYVRETIGKHFDDTAIDALAELPAGGNYLELQALCIELLNIALADGRDQVTLSDVHTIQPPAATPVPRGQAKPKPAAQSASGATALSSVLSRRAEGGAPC
jgi:type II secretory pathway predicted ATPase ExeA